jgi:hypothetical protein
MSELPAKLGSEAPEEVVGAPPEAVEDVVGEEIVVADVRALEPARPALPAVQVAAVAATGFVAGAATLALVGRASARRRARSRGFVARRVDDLPIVGSRRFLVDVHLLGRD